MSDILINLAAEFTGKNAFKSADSATKKLSNTVKTLAKTFGLAYGTAAVLGYAKASVKAAADDQKAQKQLALALQNVGLGRTAASSERYIQSLQSEFGIVDDLLRPAYQQLAVATRDSTETQRLLGIALDISASTGKDLGSVTGALSKAFLGNNTALSKLGVGISKADLKTKSFKKITDELASTFKGSAKAASETFAGSMAKLGVASANVKEIIGTGIIDALTMLGKNTSVSDLATNMETAATNVANLIRGLGVLISQLDRLPGGFKLDVAMLPIVGTYLSLLTEAGAKAERMATVLGQKNPIQSGSYLTTQKKITALAKAQLAAAAAKALADKKSADLSKAAAVFDLSKISIAAALKATYDNDTKLRLLAMQAIEDEDGKAALGYLNQLKLLQDSVQAAKLAGVTTISNASLAALNATLLAELAAIDKTKMSEDDKNKARDAAFSRYNDAITKQGGLAVANEYAERTQIQLTSIAKLAALQGYGAALATLNTIMVSNELAIATTQSANDLARYEALKAYIALLGVAYNAATALAAANAAAAVKPIVPIMPPYVPPKVPRGVLPDYLDDPVIPPYVPRVVPRGALPDYLDISNSIGNMGNGTGGNGNGNGATTIIVNTGATLGTEQVIVDAVQTALQTLNRYGSTSTYAGAIE